MKIFNILRLGLKHSVKAWKGVLIIWFVVFLLVCLVASPVRSALSAGLGSSTITDQLKNGINVEVFADLRASFKGLAAYFSKGLITIMLVWFVLNSFLSGGLFNSLRNDSGEFSSQEFFRISAKKFWPIFVISLIMSLLIFALLVFIVIIPVSVLSAGDKTPEVVIFNSAVLLSSLFFLGAIILLISADYARAWQVAHENSKCFKAISFGFRQTFRTFFSSYPLMLIIIIIQAIYMWLVMKILHGINPQSGLAVMFLFVTSQVLFIIKLFLKIWRYGCMTSLMESNRPAQQTVINSNKEIEPAYEI
jgi:hypothetical protein